MIGFGNGACMLNDLCGFYMLAAVQEHWVKKDEFDELALVHNYFFFAASGMKQAAAKAILKGRPFGGVAFLWHKSLNGVIATLSARPNVL